MAAADFFALDACVFEALDFVVIGRFKSFVPCGALAITCGGVYKIINLFRKRHRY